MWIKYGLPPALALKALGKPELTKAIPAFVVSVDEAQGIIDAVVSVFGVLDDGDDIIAAGAYVKTITERWGRIQVLDHHKADSVMRVIGKPLEMREIGREELPAEVLAKYPTATGGLWTRTQYLLDTPEGLGAFKRIASGAIREYSVGFDAIKVDYQKVTRTDGTPTNARVIREIRLWEYSPVIWGMNPATATVGVKAGDSADPDDDTTEAPAVDDDDATQPMPATVPTAQKAGTVGSVLMAQIVQCAPAYWMAEGMLSMDEYAAINDALMTAARMVYAGLPEALRDRDMRELYEAWAGGGADETKAGRVLSARNAQSVVAARDMLNAVIENAGLAMPDEEEPKNATGSAEATPVDAEREEKQQAAEPRIASLTAADLEREIADFAVAEELFGWT